MCDVIIYLFSNAVNVKYSTSSLILTDCYSQYCLLFVENAVEAKGNHLVPLWDCVVLVQMIDDYVAGGTEETHRKRGLLNNYTVMTDLSMNKSVRWKQIGSARREKKWSGNIHIIGQTNRTE